MGFLVRGTAVGLALACLAFGAVSGAQAGGTAENDTALSALRQEASQGAVQANPPAVRPTVRDVVKDADKDNPAPPRTARDVRNDPMQFRLNEEGPPETCVQSCRKWVSAVGAVMRDSAAAFKIFMRENKIEGGTLALDSSGGSVLGALELGRAIRAAGMTTTVGRTITARLVTQEPSARPYATLSPRADCESMCAFLLLAGARRDVPREARVLVHEIWLGDRRDDATAATYSAEDLVVVQRDIGRLAQYTIEMGGDIDLLETALRIPPWEPMRSLSRAELIHMKLDTVSAPDDGTTATVARVPAATGRFGRTPANAEKGWAITAGPGATALTRRHTLTVEGDEIGAFDLGFGCADTADAYTVTYHERRATGAGAAPLVSTVKIQLSRRVFALDIASSTPRVARASLHTQAKGTVPAEVIRALAGDGSRSVIVSTRSGAFETRIRVGNAGMAANMPQMEAACAAHVATVQARPATGTSSSAAAVSGAEGGVAIRAASKN